MSDELAAREYLLQAAHRVIGESISNLPSPKAIHNEERLIAAARKYVDATNHRDIVG